MAVSDFRQASKRLTFIAAAMLAVPTLASAANIGSLQIDQRATVYSGGAGTTLTASSSDFALQSGDQVRTRGGSAIVAVAGGGGLGLGPDSRATFKRDDQGVLSVSVESGTLMYSFSDEQSLRVSAGSFAVSVGPLDGQMLNVSQTEGSHGVIQRLENGVVRVAVRDGQVQVRSDAGHVYPVMAGQQRGFRLGEASEMMVQDADVLQLLIDIQSPEQVRTNQEFSVRWSTGETLREGDFITIAPVGAEEDEFEVVASTSVGEIIEFEAPGSPGDYEIRYIDGESGEIRSFVYLEVVRDRIVAYWWRDPRWIGGLAAVTGGAIYLATRDDDDDDPEPTPVSP